MLFGKYRPYAPDVATGSLLDAQLLDQFHAMSRAPFRDELARLMRIPKSRKAFRTWANKSPDRWAQAVAIFARLGGYSDKTEVEIHGTLAHKLAELQGLSDAQLEALDRQRQDERIKALGSGVTLSPATPDGKGSGLPAAPPHPPGSTPDARS